MKPRQFHRDYPFCGRFFFFSLFAAAILFSPANSYSQNYTASAVPTAPYLRLNEINTNAARHFARHFLSNGQEKWEKSEDCFVAIFGEAGDRIKNKVYYSRHGHFMFLSKTYDESQLNPNLKRTILDNFAAYYIKTVLEVSDFRSTSYFIHIVSATTIKTLKYLDGRFEVIESYQNGEI